MPLTSGRAPAIPCLSLRCRTEWVPIAWVFCVAASGVGGCAGGTTDPPTSSVAELADVDTAEPEWFIDRAQAAGLDFVHTTGRSGRFYQPEIMGPGAALFDYDNDGDLDVYLVQGQMLGATVPPEAVAPPSPVPLRGRLYRNELGSAAGPDALRFTDVTDASGIDARSYGMGVAAGDLTNDGCVDSVSDPLRTEPVVSQQLRRHVHRRVARERHGRPELERAGGVPRCRPRRLARSLRRQLPHLRHRIRT